MNRLLANVLTILLLTYGFGLGLAVLPATAQLWENQKRWVVYDDGPGRAQTVSSDQKWRILMGCEDGRVLFHVGDVSGSGAFIPKGGDYKLALKVDDKPVSITAKSIYRATYSVEPDNAVLEALAGGTSAVFSVNGITMEFSLTNSRAAIGEVVCPDHAFASGPSAETIAARSRKALFRSAVPPSLVDEIDLLASGTISVNNLTAIVVLAEDFQRRCGASSDGRVAVVVADFTFRHHNINVGNPNPKNLDPLLSALQATPNIACDDGFVAEFFKAIADATKRNQSATRFESECRARETARKCGCYLGVLEAVDPRVRSKGYTTEVFQLVRKQNEFATASLAACQIN